MFYRALLLYTELPFDNIIQAAEQCGAVRLTLDLL